MSATEHEPVPESAERRSSRSLTHVLAQVFNTPWAIQEPMLQMIGDITLMHVRGEHFTRAELDARVGAGRAQRQQVGGAVAVIPIQGVIIPKATLFSDISGGCALTRFQAMFREALADPDVGSILLDIDSPGGSVSLLEETAAVIREGRGEKPIVAFANTMIASAAYYLAAQCDEIVGTPSSMVGSIGTVALHFDYSKAFENAGVKPTIVRAGEHKFEGNPYEPLEGDALQSMQAMVDEYYSRFVRDVAKGGGTDAKTVEANYGQGRMLTIQDAVKAGVADKVETFEATVGRLARGKGSATPAKAVDPTSTPADEDQAAIAAAAENEPAEPELVEVVGASALLGRSAVRDHFAPGVINQGGH